MAAEMPVTITSEQSPIEPVSLEPVTTKRPAAVRQQSLVAAVIWLVFAVGLIAFVAFARVPIAAGWRQGRSLRVLDIWSLFVREVTVVAGPFVTPALITALVIAVLAGSLVCLWLAMAVTSNRHQDRPD